jgi:hypothetical protein
MKEREKENPADLYVVDKLIHKKTSETHINTLFTRAVNSKHRKN